METFNLELPQIGSIVESPNYKITWNYVSQYVVNVYVTLKSPKAGVQKIRISVKRGYEKATVVDYAFTLEASKLLIWSGNGSNIKLLIKLHQLVHYENRLTSDFTRLFIGTEGKDVTFKVGSVEISAHKIILVTRNSVFKKMFETNMKEKKTNVIEINDASPQAFSAFLIYIYCEEYQTNSLADELLYLGDKYQMSDLKAKAACDMLQKINYSNAIETIIKFERHQLREFVLESAKFIAQNGAKAYSEKQKKELRGTHPHLADLIEFGILVDEN